MKPVTWVTLLSFRQKKEIERGSCSVAQLCLFVTPWTAACQVSLSITNSKSLFKLTSVKSVMPSNHLVLCRSLLLLPSVFARIRVFARTRVFYNESAFRIRWPSIGTSGSVFPMNIQDRFPSGWTGWISLQSKGFSRIFSNTTVQKHQFFGAQLLLLSHSHLYMTTGKTIALTRWTFVGKVMSLFFNMLSRLIIAFLPRSKRLLFSWLQSSSAVIVEPKKIKSLTISIVSSSICHEVMGPDAMILVF